MSLQEADRSRATVLITVKKGLLRAHLRSSSIMDDRKRAVNRQFGRSCRAGALCATREEEPSSPEVASSIETGPSAFRWPTNSEKCPPRRFFGCSALDPRIHHVITAPLLHRTSCGSGSGNSGRTARRVDLSAGLGSHAAGKNKPVRASKGGCGLCAPDC